MDITPELLDAEIAKAEQMVRQTHNAAMAAQGRLIGLQQLKAIAAQATPEEAE